MSTREEITNIVINNYFKTECSVDTTIREAFEKGFRLGMKKVKAIENAPTIDAIEVVRCKDCKYGKKRIKEYGCWMLDEDWDISFSPMHFCSYGRRREDDE